MYGFRHFSLIIIVLLLAFLVSPAEADDTVVVLFKHEVRITKSTYKLADIAELNKVESALRNQLSEVEIGRTPRPGQLTQITQSELTALLEHIFPGITMHLRWEGPAFVRVRGSGVRCEAGALRRSAYQLLFGWLKVHYEQVSLQVVGEPEPIIIPEGEVEFHPKLSAATRLGKRMPVWVDVLVDGQHYQTVPIWFAVSVPASVLMVKSAMAKHQELSQKDVVEKTFDIARLSGDPLYKGDLVGKRIVHYMKAGDVITMTDVETVPMVSQGDLVTAFAHYGSVSLAAEGIALMDGNVSQIIEVRNPGSGETYNARVIGNNQVRVQ